MGQAKVQLGMKQKVNCKMEMVKCKNGTPYEPNVICNSEACYYRGFQSQKWQLIHSRRHLIFDSYMNVLSAAGCVLLKLQLNPASMFRNDAGKLISYDLGPNKQPRTSKMKL